MNHWLTHLGSPLLDGMNWTVWLMAGGTLLFCLLGIYAALLLFAAHRLPVPIRFMHIATLRGRMIVAFTLVATLPAISLALVLTERAGHLSLDRTTEELAGNAQAIAERVDWTVDRLDRGLVNVARHIETDRANWQSPDLLRRQLLDYHRNQPGFDMLLAISASGRVVAATKQIDGQPALVPATSESLAGREYFQQPLKTGVPFRSDGLSDPSLGATATVAFSVPLTDGTGTAIGVLTATLARSALTRLWGTMRAQPNAETILTDARGRVLFATPATGLRALDDLTGHSLLAGWQAERPHAAFRSELADVDGRGRAGHLAAGHEARNGWQVWLLKPIGSLRAAVFGDYAVALGWLAVTLLVSVGLGRALANNIAGPLQDLERRVRNFDLEANDELGRAPQDAPREVRSIFDHLGELGERLRTSYARLYKALRQGEKLRGELIYVVASREKEIEKRTQELKEANDTLQKLSRVDSLTGIANRRWFAEFLDQCWRSCMRDDRPLSILIIDIDDFKAYNDSYGHQKGDSCLKLVAEAIRRVVGRASDLVSRYGGEEFVVVLSDTPLDGALKVAESIRHAIEIMGIPHRAAKNFATVTVSVGVTSTVPARSNQPESFLVAADRAMYTAKHEGKNRVAYSTPAQTGLYQSLCLPSDFATRPQ